MSSRLSSLLVQDGLCTAKRVADAFQRQVIYGGTLDSNLLELKAVEEDDLIHYLGRADGMPTQPTGLAGAGTPLPEVLEVYTKEVAERFRAVPTKLLPGGILRVLVPDGVEMGDFDELALRVQQRIEPWITLEFRFVEAMDQVYGTGIPSRYARLLSRSNQSHQGRGWPPARPIDPLPRFGSLAQLRLVPEPPPPPPAPVVTAPVPPPAAPPLEEPTTLMVAPAVMGENTATLQIAAAIAENQRATAEGAPQARLEESTASMVVPDASRPSDTTTSMEVPAISAGAESTLNLTVPPLSAETTASMEVPAVAAEATPAAGTPIAALVVPPAEPPPAVAAPAVAASPPAEPPPAIATPIAAAVSPPVEPPPAAAPAVTAAPPAEATPATDAPIAAAASPPVEPPPTAAPAVAAAPPAEPARDAAIPELFPTVMVDPNKFSWSGPNKLPPVHAGPEPEPTPAAKAPEQAARTAAEPSAQLKIPESSAPVHEPEPASPLEDLNIADWMSAADWLSVANKVDSLLSARSPAPAAPAASAEPTPASTGPAMPAATTKPDVRPAAQAERAPSSAATEAVTHPTAEKSVPALAVPPQAPAAPTPPRATEATAAKPTPEPAAAKPAPEPAAAKPAPESKLPLAPPTVRPVVPPQVAEQTGKGKKGKKGKDAKQQQGKAVSPTPAAPADRRPTQPVSPTLPSAVAPPAPAAATPAKPTPAPVATPPVQRVEKAAAPAAAAPAVTPPKADKPAVTPPASQPAAATTARSDSKPGVQPASKSGSVPAVTPAQHATPAPAGLTEPPPPATPPPSEPRHAEPAPKPETVAARATAPATAAAPPAAGRDTRAPEPVPEPVNSGRLGEPILVREPKAPKAAPPPPPQAAATAVQAHAIPAAPAATAAPAAASTPATASTPAATATLAATAAPAVTAVPAATAAPAPAPSSESPLPPLGPPPRVATALDAGGASVISLEAARELIGMVEERDAVFEALCRGARSRGSFAAVLTLHGEVAFGRVALLDDWLDRSELGRVSVPLDRSSPFRSAAKERTGFVGKLGSETVSTDTLRALRRSAPTWAAVLPVLVRGRTVALLYLDDDGRELPSQLADELKPLLADVGQAFARLLQQNKAGGLGVELDDAAVGAEMPAAGTSAFRSPSGKSPVAAKPVPGDSQLTPLPPPRVPAAESPVPQVAAEQPTVPLRVSPPRPAAETEAKKPPEAAPRAAVPESINAQPTMPVATGAKVAAPAPNDVTAPIPAKPSAGKGDKRPGPSADAAPTTPAAKPATPKSGPAAEAAATARPAEKSGLAALVDRAANLDENAIDQLLSGGSEAARAVVTALPGPLRNRERQALGDPPGAPAFNRGPLLALALRMGPAAIESMVARLSDPAASAETRYYLALCLAEAPIPAALAPLAERLFDDDDAVRMAAVTALRNFPPSSELSALLGKLRDALDAKDEKRVRYAAEALGELRVVPAVPQLINLLEDEDPALVDAIGRALQTITKQDFGRSRVRWTAWWRRRQDEPRLQWLLEGLTHPSAMLRSAAQDELTSLSGDVVGYRFDQPRRDREQARRRWAEWWQRRGYPVV